MRLYVDDCRPAPNNGWHVCRTITEAQAALSRFPVEMVSLDFDPGYLRAGANGNVAVSAETFAAVAWFIRMMPEGQRPAVRVHSDNVYALETITAILPEAEPLMPDDLE